MKMLSVLLVGLLCGCGPTMYVRDDASGHTPDQFNMDDGTCKMVAQDYSDRQQSMQSNNCAGRGNCAGVGLGNGIALAVASRNAYQSCMQSKGWVRQL